ncbi:protein rolling stone-like [Ostrea edulis]|uniref:protein rolling stone-like n=1 Tax=Ostrea edulis TaxID=37623 RepID=UPI0024AEF9E1|nr:protein rolling stone-like [Ostrea edulis]
MACQQHLRPKEFGLSHQTPSDFIRLEFGPPVLYLVWSSVWGLYHFVWVCLEGYWWSLKSHYTTLDWFRQLSNVGYTVLTMFVLIDFSITLYTHCIKNRIATSDEESDTMRWYHKLTWVLYNISNSTAVMVTITYWALLSKDSPLKGSTINKHGINFIFTILTIILSRKPIKPHHVYMPMLFSLCYMIFTAIYFATTGIKVYPILDWSKTGKAIMWVVLYTLVCIPIAHLLLFGLYRLKLYLMRRFRNSSDNSPQDCDANKNDISSNRTGESSTAQLLSVPSEVVESSLENM